MIGWIRKAFTRAKSVTQQLRQQFGWGGGSGVSTLAGVNVNETTASKLAVVYASIRVLSETRGSLPLHVYRKRKSGTTEIVTQHDVAGLLSTQPNDDMTPMVWGEVSTAHVTGWGNSYTEIVWDDWGGVASLIPRHPALVDPYRSPDGELRYTIHADYDGGRDRDLDRSQVIHVPGFGFNGIVGLSPLRWLAGSIGISIAQEQTVAAFFGNKAKPGLVLTTTGQLSDEEFSRLRREIDTQYQNDAAFRALLLENGVTATDISIPMNEVQMLESREFQGEEIACRGFRLPPHVVGFLRRSTFNNVEQQDLYFEKHTMRPWLIRFEQEYNRKLFPRHQWGRFYVKHNADALLRADLKTRYEAHKSAILTGWKSRNEVRQLEDMNPLPGLDELPLPEAIWGKAKKDKESSPDNTGDDQHDEEKNGKSVE